MDRYCVICQKVYGPSWNRCCTDGSLIGTSETGLFKKKRAFYSLAGRPLGTQEVEELRRVSLDKMKPQSAVSAQRPAQVNTAPHAPAASAPGHTGSPSPTVAATGTKPATEAHRVQAVHVASQAPQIGLDPAEAEYVRKCLEPQFREEREDRKWDSPGPKDVVTLLNSGKHEECAQAAEAKAAQNSDLDLYYDWGGSAYLKMKDYARARKILVQGLAQGKRKSLNCNMMGEVEWKARNAKEATYWWVQAVHCRESIKDYAEESPYLYLHYVADGLGLSDAAAALIDRVDRIRAGGIRLNPASAADLRDLVRQQPTPGMRSVLTGLCDRYLKPSPAARENLPEPEEMLNLLLRQIESQLKNRPNPEFSMVNLGLQRTPLGRKIVWCYRTRYDEPCAMDAFAAANFLNHELKAIGVTVSSAGSMGGRGGEGNQLFDYDFQTTVPQSAADTRELGSFASHTDIVDVAVFIPDGKHAVSLGREQTVKAWDLKTFVESRVISDRDLMWGVLGVRPTANHVLLVYGQYRKSSVVRQWDLDRGKLSDVCQLNTEIVDGLHNAVFSADCQLMLGVGFKTIGLWSLSGPKLISHFEVITPVGGHYCKTALSADAQSILCAEGDNVIHLINATSGQRTIKLVGHEGRVNELRFTPSGDVALSCSDDQTVRVWDLQSGKELRCLRGHTSGIWCLDVSGDGKYAASAGSGYPESGKDCTVRIWDINTGSEVARYVGHSQGIRSVRFNRSGELLMSASVDKTVRLWNLQ
jgi:WD40 repeat protein